MPKKWLSSLLNHLQLKLEPDTLVPEEPFPPSISIAGLFNPLHCCYIQIIGPSELQQLESLSHGTQKELFEHICNNGTKLIIFADTLQAAGKANLAVGTTLLSANEVLARCVSESKKWDDLQSYQHGVFLDVLGSGVLLTGTPNIGKSELALELITRGHSLVADDAPSFCLTPYGAIQGSSNDILREFIEVRGLGIMNVRAMFGDNAVKHSKDLDLIIYLRQFDHIEKISTDRLFGTRYTQNLLEQQIDTIEIPVAAGRNLAVLVETAVRNYNLKLKGYNSAREFIKRQQRAMDSKPK